MVREFSCYNIGEGVACLIGCVVRSHNLDERDCKRREVENLPRPGHRGTSLWLMDVPDNHTI